MAQAKRDENRIPVMLGVTDDGNSTPTQLIVDPTTKRLKCTATLANVTPAGGGTGQTTYTKGDILVARNSTTLDKLAVGSDGNVLTADAASTDGVKWAAPAAGSGTVTSVSVTTANGVSGSVATATTTPAITVTLGAITPTTVNKVTVTAPAAGSTLTIDDGFTLHATGNVTALSGSHTGTSSGTNTGDQTSVSGNAGTVTTNANLTGPITSVGNATSIASQTGTGSKFVVDTSPTLVTPILGVATATSVNKVAFTAPTTAATVVFGTDNATVTFQGTDTYVGRATSDTLTNKTLTTPTISKPVMSATNPTAQAYSPAGAGTATLDLSLSNQHDITMPAGNITIALSNDTNNQIFIVTVLQDGTGSRTVTWFTTIRWAGGVAPTLTTTASKRDMFGFKRTGSGTYDGFVIGQNI